MTFLSFMRKEKTRQVFKSSKDAFGTARLKKAKSDKTTSKNIDEVMRLRSESRDKEYGIQPIVKFVILLFGFIFLVYFLLNLFIDL